MEDRFGDNGVVAISIGRVEREVCHIELWLMSCRVLKRDMEYAMMDMFVQRCIERGVTELIGYYNPTAKNSMVKEFYKLMGFELILEENNSSIWKLKISDGYVKQNKHILVED